MGSELMEQCALPGPSRSSRKQGKSSDLLQRTCFSRGVGEALIWFLGANGQDVPEDMIEWLTQETGNFEPRFQGP